MFCKNETVQVHSHSAKELHVLLRTVASTVEILESYGGWCRLSFEYNASDNVHDCTLYHHI